MKCHMVAAAMILATLAGNAGAATAIPLPRPRPPSAPDAQDLISPAEQTGRDKSLSQTCMFRLASEHAVFTPLGRVAGPGDCGGTDVVLLDRFAVNEREEIAIQPAATLRCDMAIAVIEFVRFDLVPAVGAMGSVVRALENYGSYDCRGRNGVPGAKVSEHGKANALDIRSITLDNGHALRPSDAGAPKDFRLAMRSAACARFTTVLGPGSDGFHEDHIHIDLAQRSNGYRLCQWVLYGMESEKASRAGESAVPLPRPRGRNGAFARPPIESRSP